MRQTRPGEQQAPTAEEEQRERNGTGLSEADQIVLNREISTVRWREFDDRKLRIRTKKIANTLEVFTTNSRKRWYRHLQKSLESKKRVAADKGLKSRWYKLTMADKALWNAERQHLEARRMKMHEVLTLENKFGLPEPFWLDGREENGWLA